ncbi:MAG: GNAT family N-acetyltransferase [Oscillospiraceae bacterium]|nr:GNAT family N-acetyltransferase [Oscillospiraceae bacterium]
MTVTPMKKEHVGFVIYLLNDESVKAALHLEDAPRKEREKALRKNLRDRDEANFILCRGGEPIGWLKLNGLKGDMAWISMLAVHPAHQRQGAGRFAARYAEEFARGKGFTRLGIHTTKDNAPAQSCYEKSGYALVEENDKLTYIKELGRNT